jgi:hypothetical protein
MTDLNSDLENHMLYESYDLCILFLYFIVEWHIFLVASVAMHQICSSDMSFSALLCVCI